MNRAIYIYFDGAYTASPVVIGVLTAQLLRWKEVWRNNAVLRWRLSERSNWAIDTLLRVVSRWRIFATQAHISRDEQERMAGAVYDENVTIRNLCRFFVTLRQFVHVRVERCAFPRSLYVRHHEDRQVPPELADVLNTSE